MVSFERKDVTGGSIGDLLRAKRLERGLDFAAVEKATRISKKYLEAVERHEFARLPDFVYAKNFVRALAAFYGLDPEPLAKGLAQEMAAAGGRAVGLDRPANFIDGRRLPLTPGLVKAGAAALVFLAIAGYFAVSVYSILKPPKITVTAPLDNQASSSRQVVLEGRTEPEAELTVNREPVLIEADGAFRDSLLLPPGVSILRVAAKKKHSREQEVFIKVMVEEEKEPTASATASQP